MSELGVKYPPGTETSRVTCKHCGTLIKLKGLRKHYATPGCQANQLHNTMLRTGWVSRHTYGLNFTSISPIVDYVHRTCSDSPHITTRLTRYQRGGWGRRSCARATLYIHLSLIKMWQSKQFTPDELLVYAMLPEHDATYRAALALTSLSGAAEEVVT